METGLQSDVDHKVIVWKQRTLEEKYHREA